MNTASQGSIVTLAMERCGPFIRNSPEGHFLGCFALQSQGPTSGLEKVLLDLSDSCEASDLEPRPQGLHFSPSASRGGDPGQSTGSLRAFESYLHTF